MIRHKAGVQVLKLPATRHVNIALSPDERDACTMYVLPCLLPVPQPSYDDFKQTQRQAYVQASLTASEDETVPTDLLLMMHFVDEEIFN